MIVIKKIYVRAQEGLKNTDFFMLDKVSIDTVRKSLLFDLYDSNNDKSKSKVTLNELLSHKNIFGIVESNLGYIFISTSDYDWKFLDIVCEPKHTNLFIKDKLNEFDVAYDYYKEVNKNIYIFFKLESLNEHFTFWTDTGYTYVKSILNVYSYILKYTEDLSDDLEIYIVDTDSTLLKLDTRKEVLRFVSKYNILKGNMSCC